MGEVIAFKLKPVIRVEQIGGLWAVSVRPCRDELPSLKSFDNWQLAAAYATGLKAEYGWPVRPERFDLDAPLDGAA